MRALIALEFSNMYDSQVCRGNSPIWLDNNYCCRITQHRLQGRTNSTFIYSKYTAFETWKFRFNIAFNFLFILMNKEIEMLLMFRKKLLGGIKMISFKVSKFNLLLFVTAQEHSTIEVDIIKIGVETSNCDCIQSIV